MTITSELDTPPTNAIAPTTTKDARTSKVQIGFIPLEDMLQASYELNPRQHSIDLDIRSLAHRLLALGWCEHITVNARNGKIVDGHGRVMACEWLSNQSEEWFAAMWDSAANNLTESDRERYSPVYWLQCSVIVANLDEESHAAVNLGLNNEKVQGVDDPAKISALADRFSEQDKALAGFAVRIQAIASEISSLPSVDFQGKQVFEHPDATDYCQDDEAIQPDESSEDEPILPRILNLSVTFTDWKKWKAYKDSHGYTKDADCFYAGLREVFPSDLSFAKNAE